jgi:hypothetical protein
MQKRFLQATLAALLSFGLVACGGDSSSPTAASTPPPAPTKAKVTFNVDPNPVISEYQGNGWYRFKVNLEFYDTAGVGFTINSVRTTVTAPITGAILLDYDYSVTTKVGPKGRDVLQFTSPLYWTLAGGGADVKFIADITDDKGNALTLSNEATVLHRGGPKHELPD